MANVMQDLVECLYQESVGEYKPYFYKIVRGQ